MAVLVHSVKLNHTSGGRDPEFNLQVGKVGTQLGGIERHQVVAFVFDLAVVAPRKRAGVPDPRRELLTKVNMAEPDVLCLQAPQWFEGVLGAPPDQGLAAADASPRHPEMPEEEFVASRPALEALVELFCLPDKRFLKSLLVADHLSFPWIREDRERSPAQIDELRLSAEVDVVFPPCTCVDVKIPL